MKAVPEQPSPAPAHRETAQRAEPPLTDTPTGAHPQTTTSTAATATTATGPPTTIATSVTGPPTTTGTATAAPTQDRRRIQHLQRLAGNAAVSRLVAQRYTAPVKPPPAQSARFRAVKSDVAAKRTKLAAHAPPTAESKASQDAAVAPPDDKEAQGKAANAEKMNAAKPGEFDKKAFVDAVNQAIDAQAPKNLDEADKFAGSGKAEQVRAEVDGKVTDGKESSAKDIETSTKAPPDTSAAQEKAVTPLTPDRPPADPGAPSATDAVPEKQPAAVTDFSEGPAANEKAMADAEVTEEQFARSNEPEFTEALSAKRTAETDAAKAPAKGRAAENAQLSAAKANAAASGAQAMTALTATRSAAGKQVDGGKNDTKSKDEKKRAEVTAKLQKVYDATKKDVEETLSGLDKKVDTAFTSGEKAARDAFTADHKSRMKKYKDKRYSGLRGKARWVKDKFTGLPKEANDLYQESRKLYVSRMQTVISSVADLIGAELGRAKARIAKGRTELKAEVDRLPTDLRQFGEEAAKDFAGKFDDLEATVDEKSEQLVQDLAQKYTAALNKIDEEITKLQEANRGLIDKAKDAIAGVIRTINELKNLLLGILAKAASAIMKIIKDPIGFLGNLVTAVGAGLNLFITNIADHLKTGLVSWLLGTAVKAGLDLPARFDLKGIIQLIGSMLGLTWDNIRTRITRKGVPDEAMSKVETSVPVARSLAREGPAGATKEIQAETGDLKSTILGKLTTYLIPTVLIAGITWIISLLNPASAFVRAVKGIIDIVTFIVTQGAQIADFVNAVLDAVIAIANGAQAGVPKLIESALATSVPLLIGFLAALLGIGGLANKVKSVFQSVSRPVTRAIDKLVDFIAKKGRALWAKRNTASKNKQGNFTGEGKNKSKNESAALADADRALAKADSHEVAASGVRAVERRHDVPLRLIVDSTTPQGKVVYVQTARTPHHTLRDENQTRNEIKAAMRDKHNKALIEQVHPYWWSVYISKVRTGPLPSSPTLFSQEDLKGTDDTARALTQTDSFVQPLLGYFKGNRKTAEANDFYNHVFSPQNPQRKAFLKALGSPVPAELARLAKSRLPSIVDESFRTSLDAGIKQLGPGSYKADVPPYGQFDLPQVRQKEHSDYFPENIHLVVEGTTATTTYTTRAGKKFTVVEKGKDRSESLTVTGYDLSLKTRGAPRGITQTPAGFVEGEEFNRAHGVADMFGGSGFREGLNLVSTSDHYNKHIQGAAERSIEANIRSFATLNGVDVDAVSMDLTVTITFGMLVGDILKDRVSRLPWYTESDPESQQRFLDLLRTVSNPPIRRAEETTYQYTLKVGDKSREYTPPRVGADEWLFVRKSGS
ncbi:phage tail protein [Streptomyces bacillaris]